MVAIKVASKQHCVSLLLSLFLAIQVVTKWFSYLMIKNTLKLGAREMAQSAVKGNGCSTRGPRFNPQFNLQHPHRQLIAVCNCRSRDPTPLPRHTYRQNTLFLCKILKKLKKNTLTSKALESFFNYTHTHYSEFYPEKNKYIESKLPLMAFKRSHVITG